MGQDVSLLLQAFPRVMFLIEQSHRHSLCVFDGLFTLSSIDSTKLLTLSRTFHDSESDDTDG